MGELREVTINLSALEKGVTKTDLRNVRHQDVCGSKPHEERTDCCNAPVIMQTGGIVGYVCSDCGKPYTPGMFRPLK